ncbi:MAG: hypothetical protein CMJ72_12545 [Planctomycetaceae bacterium]|nr:hypothetical protein [Planctomycetaceae bacterium]
MPCHFLTRADEALGRIIQQLCLGRVGYEGEVMATALYNGNCYFGTLLMANVFRMDNSQFTYMLLTWTIWGTTIRSASVTKFAIRSTASSSTSVYTIMHYRQKHFRT